MIGILDMNMGNLRSVSNAIYSLGYDYEIVKKPSQLSSITHLIIPGVGAYATAISHLHRQEIFEQIKRVANEGMPILGLCLGMQLLSESGDEGGPTTGLGLIPGHVKRLDPAKAMAIPHVGWNNIHLKTRHPVFSKVRDNIDFYFVHSYHFESANPDDSLGSTDCGQEFTSIVGRKNVLGFQFHPEKSQTNGLKLLDNFCQWNGTC